VKYIVAVSVEVEAEDAAEAAALSYTLLTDEVPGNLVVSDTSGW
jgi:hypothetical protein